MNVFIAEDEKLAAERLSQLIRECDAGMTILEQTDSVQDAVEFLSTNTSVDLLFLDIQLADGKSFEIFEKIPVEVPVIFTTAYDQYALQAFKHHSIDYLLKPVQKTDLQQALKKFQKFKPTLPTLSSEDVRALKTIIHQTQQQYKQRLLVKAGNKLLYKALEDTAYFYADGKSAYMVVKNDQRKYLIDHTLEELEALIDPNRFFRISRKFIVHIDAVAEVRGTISTRMELKLTQPCEHDLTISRDKTSQFKTWLDR